MRKDRIRKSRMRKSQTQKGRTNVAPRLLLSVRERLRVRTVLYRKPITNLKVSEKPSIYKDLRSNNTLHLHLKAVLALLLPGDSVDLPCMS